MVQNYIDGTWQASAATETMAVINPASGEELARTPLSTAAEIGDATTAAARAFGGWRRVPVTERVQYLFRLKARMEEAFEDLSRTITLECGKTLAESRGEMRRAVENVEVACGTPLVIQGYTSEDIASGIDETMIRQPLGVCAIVAPFNFPGMIPFWFLPYALACGNTVVLKPSERVPLTMQKVPDADIASASEIVADSAFGCAGQRCLASSVAVAVGAASGPFGVAIRQRAESRVTGNGLDDGVQMGPVISAASRARIAHLVDHALRDGARAVIDGRDPEIAGYRHGYFVRPTVLEDLPLESEVARTEIFGPVLSVHHVDDIEQAIALVNAGDYGNQACLFTSSGASARKFRYEAEVGNIGINVGVAAPMAFFPFSGARGSFFGDLHGQGRDAIEFFTQEKVVVERWPNVLSRTF